MRIDSQFSFIPLGSSFSLVGGAGVNLPSNVLDLLGVTSTRPTCHIDVGQLDLGLVFPLTILYPLDCLFGIRAEQVAVDRLG